MLYIYITFSVIKLNVFRLLSMIKTAIYDQMTPDIPEYLVCVCNNSNFNLPNFNIIFFDVLSVVVT